MQHDSPTEALVDSLPPYEYDAAITRPLMPSTTRSQTPPAFEHPQSECNLPSSYFILRSRAPKGRCLDVLGHRSHHGAEIGLHPVKEPVVRFNDLQNSQSNQVLFLDWNGHLQSASASRPIDASLQDGLSICVQRPIMAIPSPNSHPLPRFRLDPSTSVLMVEFGADPSYPGPTSTSTAWRDDYEYILESVPVRRKLVEETSVWATAERASKDLLAGLGQGLGQLSDATPRALVAGFGETLGGIGDKLGGLGLFNKSTPSSPRLDGPPPPPPPKSSQYPGVRQSPTSPPVASTSSYRHPDSPLPSLPQDDPYDSDNSDSEPSAFRPLRVVRLSRATWREKLPAEVLQRPPGLGSPQLGLAPSSSKELRKWRRRQWEVVPIVVRPKAVDGVLPPPPLASSHLPDPPGRWSASTLASSAGGLVTSISGGLRSPLISRSGAREDEDQFAVGDEDALAVDSSEIERYARRSPTVGSPSLVPIPTFSSRPVPAPPRMESPLPTLPLSPAAEDLAVPMERASASAGVEEVVEDAVESQMSSQANVADVVGEGDSVDRTERQRVPA